MDADDTLFGNGGDDFLTGGGGRDSIFGGNENDGIIGEGGDDFLHGGRGDDIIFGFEGNDTLVGGSERDDLIGDSGNDTFDFNLISDSVVGAKRDVIHGFDIGSIIDGDRVDLSTIDANVTFIGDQRFDFIGTIGFFAPGQARVTDVQGPFGQNTLIQLNTDFDLFAESEIEVSDGSTSAFSWTSFDFVL